MNQTTTSTSALSPFAWGVALSALLAGGQLAVGLLGGSLALVGLALHKLVDVGGLLLAWAADGLARRPPQGRFTWGLGRTTQLAALINALLILLAGALVAWEALQRLQRSWPEAGGATDTVLASPDPVPVLIAALAGVAINLLAARLFGGEHQPDLNRRAAALHLLSDAALLGAVLLSAALTAVTAWPWLDPITAIAVGMVVAGNGLVLLQRSLLLALDAVPAGVDASAVQSLLQSLPGVKRVGELRLWGVSTGRTALCAHLELAHPTADQPRQELLQQARAGLRQLGIDTCTLELEVMA